MNKALFIKERLFKLAGALILVISMVFGWFLLDYQQFASTPLKVGEGVDIVVEPGQSLSFVVNALVRQGLMQNSRYLLLRARLKNVAHRIQAGEYHLEPGTTPVSLLDKLVAGDVVDYALTIVEGWNFRELMEVVNNNPYLKHSLKGLDNNTIMKRLGFEGEHPEGRFLPDTYHFPRGLSDVAFLQRAHRAMEEYLIHAWEKRDEGLPLQSAYEALILASIVEKETGQPDERPAISGVFVRRLQQSIRLQTDPTVIYGLGLAFDGNLRRIHLKQRDNPYNSYRHKGLPPTPIAMPGAAAIEAALHPAAGDTLYFVSKGDGSHQFSATLREHNNAVIKYQLKGRKRSFSSYSAQ